MKRWIKWAVLALAGGVAVLAAVAALGYEMAGRKMARKLDIPVKPVAFQTSPRSTGPGGST